MTPIEEWLGSLGLSEYADRFAENRIDLSILQDLTDPRRPSLVAVESSSSAWSVRPASNAVNQRRNRAS